MVGDPGRADGGGEGRVRADRQAEGAGHVPQRRLGQGHLPLRRAAEEVPAGAVPAPHEPLT